VARPTPAHPGWLLLATIVIAGLCAYLGAVLLLGETIGGASWGLLHWGVSTLTAAGLAYAGCRMLVRRGWCSLGTLAATATALAVLLIALILADIGYSAYLNVQRPPGASPVIERHRDVHLWIGEFYPSLYYPTSANFRMHKPGLSVTASAFGNFYSTPMLRSPTLTTRVLEERRVTIRINADGFRDSGALAEARIFALGDSLTFGWGVDEEQSWVGQLEAAIGRPVYNLGIHDASPEQERLLLLHLLRERAPPILAEHVLWLIYEGNDLEDSYEARAPQAVPVARSAIFGDTLLGLLLDLPRTVRNESMIYRLRSGQSELRFGESPHWRVDGVELPHPLYESPQLGMSLFYRDYLERATLPRSYVRDHPNRPKLERAFAGMAELAREHGFRVTVLLAPTSVRLHGRYFQDLPALSAQPHFLDLVGELARRHEFGLVDLLAGLEPDAGQQLLYFRDDDNWNVPGNQRVAELVARQLFSYE
jgi:hypothetical protein